MRDVMKYTIFLIALTLPAYIFSSEKFSIINKGSEAIKVAYCKSQGIEGRTIEPQEKITLENLIADPHISLSVPGLPAFELLNSKRTPVVIDGCNGHVKITQGTVVIAEARRCGIN